MSSDLTAGAATGRIRRIVVVTWIAVAALLVLVAALTPLDADTAAGMLLGATVGGGLGLLGAARAKRRSARAAHAAHDGEARRRSADRTALDRLEPLRSDDGR